MRTLLFVSVLACAAAAQEPGQPTGAISGRVLAGYGGPPVRGAAVTAMQGMKELGLAWSGQDGRYIIEGLPPGRYNLVATKPALGAMAYLLRSKAAKPPGTSTSR